MQITKPAFTYHFADEPQFKCAESRAWVANYLLACRNPANCGRVTVRRVSSGVYQVRTNAINSPVAIIARA